MKRSVTVGVILSSLVLVGVLSAQYVLQPSGRVFQAGVPTFSTQSFAPHPRNIVNFCTGELTSDVTYISIPSLANVSLFDVPADKYLVLTQYNMTSNHGNTVALAESDGGVSIIKAHRNQGDEADGGRDFSPLGFVFRPGTSVSLFNTDAIDSHDIEFSFIGYLVDA